MAVRHIGILYKAEPMHPFDILPQHIEAIQETMPSATVVRAYEENELINSGADSEVLLTWGLYRPAAFCRAASNLQWIHALTAGIDGLISTPEICGRRIRVSATKSIHGLPMAEHTLGHDSFVRARLPCTARPAATQAMEEVPGVRRNPGKNRRYYRSGRNRASTSPRNAS